MVTKAIVEKPNYSLKFNFSQSHCPTASETGGDRTVPHPSFLLKEFFSFYPPPPVWDEVTPEFP